MRDVDVASGHVEWWSPRPLHIPSEVVPSVGAHEPADGEATQQLRIRAQLTHASFRALAKAGHLTTIPKGVMEQDHLPLVLAASE